MMKTIMNYLKLIPKSIKTLNAKNPLQLASSTAFFSVLAIPPILVILVTIIGIFVKPEYLNTEIFDRISVIMGNTGSEELQKLFDSFQKLSGDSWASIGVFAFLLFIGTNLFFLIELNINQIWDIPSKSNINFVKHLSGRLTSIFLLFLGGVLLILALLLDTAVSFIDERMATLLPELNTYLVPVISQLFSLLTFSIWYSLLFKILPNAKLKWKPAIIGGVIMAVLFKLGQIVISNVLINGSIESVFAASGSIVLVMLFVFYTSFIFYFVSMFIKQYCELTGVPISPQKVPDKEE